MKINTYKEYSELYKTAGVGRVADEGAQALTRLMRGLDEAGNLASPSLKALLEGVGESATGITREVEDIFGYVDSLISEAIAMQKKVDSGELVQELHKSTNALAEADRKRKKHWSRYQSVLSKNKALREEMVQLATKYDEALEKALSETSDLRKTVESLNRDVSKITDEAAEAASKLKEAAQREGQLTKKLAEVQKALAKSTEHADEVTSVLDTLRKEHAELTALYEKTLKEADEARAALKAAEDAGLSGPALGGLRAMAESKGAAATTIGSRLTKGDKAAQKGLEGAARAEREAGPKAKAPTLKTEAPKAETPKAETPKAKTPSYTAPKGRGFKSKVPETSRGAASKGFRQGIQESFRQLASKGVAGVTGAAIKTLGGLALFAFVGLPILTVGALALYTLWNWYVRQDIEAARANARSFDRILRNAHAKLSQVVFKDGTRTQQIQQSYLDIMKGCFGLVPEMVERADDGTYIQEAGIKLQALLQQTETFLGLKDLYALDLQSPAGWSEAIVAIQELDAAGKQLHGFLEQAVNGARNSQQSRPAEGTEERRPGGGVAGRQRPEPSPDDKGIKVLGERVYLSQYPELDPATRSAAPYLINKVLLSPTGLSFWDPEGKWGGGYLRNRGSIADQVIKHIRFFLNPRAVDSDWAYGPINNVRKLRKFMRKNMPKAGRKPGSGYKSTRREYRRNKPSLAFSNNINISNVDSAMGKRKNRLEMLEKIASSTNRTGISVENIEKYADSISKEYYQGALRGLDDQYAKSYYTGLKSMYDQKLGGGKADYKSLYEPHGGTGTEILEDSHPNSVVVSDAMGNGGLVENVLEQQRHNIGVALSTPTGNFRGKHANLVAALTKIANNANNTNNLELLDIVDEAIEDIVAILKS